MLSIGIDLGGHTLSAGIVDLKARPPFIISRIDMPSPAGRHKSDVIGILAEAVAALAGGNETDSVGIGMPGFLDKKRETVVRLTNFPAFEDVRLPDILKEIIALKDLHVNVSMENDANCAALGEGIAGAARGCHDYIVITLGTGIGAGIVANGALVAGGHGIAGEAGHLSIMEDGILCCCGGISHLESAASADAIEKAALKCGMPADFKYIWEHRDEKEAETIVERALDSLARGIASLVATTDPERVILSGGMSKARGLAGELAIRVPPYLPAPFRPYLNIVTSSLGGDAAIIGAASLSAKAL